MRVMIHSLMMVSAAKRYSYNEPVTNSNIVLNRFQIKEGEESKNDNNNKNNELLSQYDQLFKSFRCEMSPSMLALLAIMKATSATSTNITALNAKLNHNILQPSIMAEFTNNVTGNKAGIPGLPKPFIDNDDPHLMLLNLVSFQIRMIWGYLGKSPVRNDQRCLSDDLAIF